MARGFVAASSQYMYNATGVVTAAPLSISCWLYPTNSGTLQVFGGLWNSAANTDYFRLDKDTGNLLRWRIARSSTAGAISVAAMNINAWNHAAGIEVTNASHFVWLNGVKSAESTTSKIPAGINSVAIARHHGSTPANYMDGYVAEFAVWNAALADAEVTMLSKGCSPLVVRPQSLVLYIPLIRDNDKCIFRQALTFSLGGVPAVQVHPKVFYPAYPRPWKLHGISSTPLTVQDMAQAQSVDNVALTQHNLLVIANATQAQVVDALVLAQHNILAVQDMAQAQAADALVLGVGLLVAHAAQAQGVENIALTQHNALAVQDMAQAQATDNIILTQHNILVVDDLAQAQAMDELTLTYHPPAGVVLAVQDMAQAQAVDNLSLTQHNALAVGDEAQTQSAENVVLTQHNLLAVESLSQVQAVDHVTLAQHNLLAIADASQAQAVDNLTLTAHDPGATTLAVQDCGQTQSVESFALIQHHLLAVQDAMQSQGIDNPSLTQHNALTIQSCAQTQNTEPVALVQHHVLTVDNLTQAQMVSLVVLILAAAGRQTTFKGMFRNMSERGDE